MDRLKSILKKHPVFYIFGSFLVIIAAEIWAFFQLIHISWVLAAIFVGIQIPLGNSLSKHIRPTVWSIIGNLAASFAYVWVLFVLDGSWWAKCLHMILFLPIFILANRALQYDVEQDMRRRSRRATQIMEQALSMDGSKVPKFGLYLRPFVTTDHLPAQTISNHFDTMMESTRASHVDMETIFRRAFDQELDLIAFGRPEDILEGVARVTVRDEGWHDVVRQLADKATLIMVVPFSHEGTLWELRELKSRGHIGKTVFLMPETQLTQPNGVVVPVEEDRAWDAGIIFYDPAAHFLDIAEEWEQAREILNGEGIFLPPYAHCGALFTLNPDTAQVKQIAPLLLSMLIQRQEYLRTVLTEFDLIPWRAKSNTDLLNAFEASTFPTHKNREYVLTFALELFANLGDTETASTILQRIHSLHPHHHRP